MNNPRILVTGAGGQLGRSLERISHIVHGYFTFASRQDLDISDAVAVREYFAAHTFDFCINTAAFTQVDLAEQNIESAHLLNVIAPGLLAEACSKQQCTLIHISSDYVYHNDIVRPLREDDPTNPVSVYARTKFEGEQVVIQGNPQTIVLRTSWLFSEYGYNFVKTMVRLLTAGKALRVVDDQYGCPTYCGDLAEAIMKIIHTIDKNSDTEMWGIFNYCCEGPVSWYGFACEIASYLEISPDITPVTTAEYGAAAARPPYSVLDTTKIEDTFSVATRHWREGLIRVLHHSQ